MKEKMVNNLGLKILSLFLAFFVWLVVVNVSNPWVTGYQEVPLDIENEEILLNANRTYEITNGKNTVTVSYKVQARDEYKIKASDFRAYIDLAELYAVTGSVPVNVEVLNNRALLNEVEPRQSVVRIETEELQKKPFELTIRTVGEPEEGYAINGIEIDPDVINVEGPVSQVGQISHAGIEVDVTGLNEDMTAVAVPKFYDSNDNEIPLSSRVTADTDSVEYRVSISRVKKVPLDFEVSGTVADGYQYVGAEASVSTVSVIGLRSSLASLNKITIPSSVLNISGASSDQVVNVNLNDYLPSGVRLAGTESEIVEIHLKVEKLVQKTFQLTLDDLVLEGVSDLYSYELVPERVDVTVEGLQEDLDSLTAVDLGASISVASMGPGLHAASLVISSAEGFQVVSAGQCSVEVSLIEPGVTLPQESETREESGESEESETKETNEAKETAETEETETQPAEGSKPAAG